MPKDIDITETQEAFLGFVRQSQEQVVAAVQNWAETVSRLTPETGAVQTGDWYVDPAEAVDRSFDFVEQVLASQRRFAHEVLSATEPVVKAAERNAPTSR
ncbi:MAG: hypothetical protein KY434_03830 [Actinobacteria bacterium]|nr:hypothetical protein [Actinomycetota bacterium]